MVSGQTHDRKGEMVSLQIQERKSEFEAFET